MSQSVCLEPLTSADFPVLATLAGEIWHQHFISMISREQIEYMLASRYVPEKLSAYLDAPDRWFCLLKLDGRAVGYCSYALTATPGEMKLEQLYLLAEMRGRGLGAYMLDAVERAARQRGCHTLVLTVNKHNAGSIAVYQRRGFLVREEAVFDIGNGFVMDDYVMEKRLV
ncbi:MULTISPECIES: GNAT family N-acetyltransferase [Chromobacterium]|uniref:GNAT family N-acetyltransferase n=1 Tax=Chromobacterium TaxID=535 RepID=UPI0018896A23|nr:MULTISPECIES: GNAT family N-acetyltransferase [Chromobacterium]QOZ84796.1 GNAT family N-acetyltransferase [Chromobacterium sp. Rain0013]WON84988.1 GNAT family N-acetyltransferase [Chromobacterium haemolyticum]